MFGRFNGMVFCVLLFLSSLFGSIFILFPFIPFAYFLPRLWRFCADRFVGYWLIYPTSMLFFLFNVKFHLTGDIVNRSKPALIIMNHRTRLDWLFFWNVLYKMDPWLLTTEKISLKSSLKRIPGAGWAMGCGAYIFMNRSYEQDTQILSHLLKYYKDSTANYQLLLFPEGTDRGAKAVRLSNEFARKNDLDCYDYVLHPRTSGFNFIINRMLENNYINSVYDVTVGYPDRIICSEMDLLRDGQFPKSVHFHIKQYSIDEIISSAKSTENGKLDCSEWLNGIWKAKEERLRRFYQFNDIQRHFVCNDNEYKWPVDSFGIAYYIAFGFWIIFSIFWIYHLMTCWQVQLYAIIAISFYTFANHRYGGVEFLVLEWFYGKKMIELPPNL